MRDHSQEVLGFSREDGEVIAGDLADAWNRHLKRIRPHFKSVSKNITQKELYAFLFDVYTNAFAVGYQAGVTNQNPKEAIPLEIPTDGRVLTRADLMCYTTKNLPEKFHTWVMFDFALTCRVAVMKFFKDVKNTIKQRSS